MGASKGLGLCSRCGVGERLGRSYCRSCRREIRAIYKAGGNLGPRKKAHPRDGLISEMDDHPTACLFGFWTTKPCPNKATHRSGQWRACGEHRHPEDVPIEP